MDFLWKYVRQKSGAILAFVLCVLVFAVVFALYHFPLKAVAYPAALCLVILGVFTALDLRRVWRHHRRLSELQKLSASLMDAFPKPDGVLEADYQALISLLRQGQARLTGEMTSRYNDMVEYYTVWFHQIKTPIAAMRLTLQNEDSELSRMLTGELLEIEQYVEMVLTYFRLESSTTDYVFGEYPLDEIVKAAVRPFAPQFIRKRIQLIYEPLNVTVLTDEKWLIFVLQQLLSNALKYTPAGSVSIDLEPPMTLCIRDTGIGIDRADLPRIFEMGYTGFNGRSSQKASGVGLYLCRRICKNLGHTLSAESEPGQGTLMRLDLARKPLEVE